MVRSVRDRLAEKPFWRRAAERKEGVHVDRKERTRDEKVLERETKSQS